MQYTKKPDGYKIQKFQTHIWNVVTNAGNVRMKSILFLWCYSPYWARTSYLLGLHDHTQTHHTR
jgi:hypothetical protein